MMSGTGTRTDRHRGPVDRAGDDAEARTGAGSRCRATWASTWGGGTQLSLSDDNRATGSGNFYLQPNGVFLIDNQGARVLATDEYRVVDSWLLLTSCPACRSGDRRSARFR